MKNHLYALLFACSAAVLPSSAATFIIMDYDDGDAGNGIHDSNINNGDVGAQTWVGNHQYETNNNSGVGSNQNLVLGSDRSATHIIGGGGYTVQVGDTITSSFMWRAASNWDANDRPVFSIFYFTDDDFISGTRVNLFSYEVATSNDTTYREESVPTHVISDTDAAGKTFL